MPDLPSWAAWLGGAGVLLAPVGALVLLRRGIAIIEVCGVSMLPTLQPGERVVARRIPARRLRVGNIVVYRATELATPLSAPDHHYRQSWRIKRVAAVPGDPVPEPIAVASRAAAGAVVPDRVILVLGDNTAQSLDSRHTGAVRWDDVYGIVWRRLRDPASL
jgi:signal peptidase I